MSHFLYPIINFAILFLGLSFVLKRGLGGHFKKQRDDLDQKIRAAGHEYEAMQRQFNETRAMMDSLEKRITEMQFNASREVQLETKKMEFETERFVERLISDGELKMRAEVLAMKANLERDLMVQSMAAARQVLERDIKASDSRWTENMLDSDSAQTRERKNYAS